MCGWEMPSKGSTEGYDGRLLEHQEGCPSAELQGTSRTEHLSQLPTPHFPTSPSVDPKPSF